VSGENCYNPCTYISAVVGASTTQSVRKLATRVSIAVEDVDKCVARLLARNISPDDTSDVGVA